MPPKGFLAHSILFTKRSKAFVYKAIILHVCMYILYECVIHSPISTYNIIVICQ